MTPKEKAFELKYKYSKLLDLKSTDELVIKCALITVDELIKKEISLLGLNEDYITTWYNWVKEEIQKL
jgi:hypothetical protein